MSRYSLTVESLRAILHRHPGYEGIRVFVETGTYEASTTLLAHAHFAEVHSVEISEPLYAHAMQFYGSIPGVHFYLGDSRPFVAGMARGLQEPVFWFLDAHWFRKTRQPVGGRDEGLPLWDELAAIAARETRGDIVLLDDVHVFGKADPSPDWERVSLQSIADALPGHVEAVILGPHAVIYR